MAATFKLLGLILLVFTLVEANNGGFFSVDLIQRDSPRSPFFDPSQTHSDRLHNAFLRSISRMNHLKRTLSASAEALQSPLVHNGGEYFMNISIGTPQVELIGIADTGSDLTWIQCKPCENCYKQKPQVFDPKRSSTYKNVSCGSSYCSALDFGRRCDPQRKLCRYSYSYGDNSFTEGNLAVENFAIGNNYSTSATSSVTVLENLVFGCGHNNGGTFNEVGSGIIGLGGGPLSLVSQLSKHVKGKFSYCLVPITSSETNNLTSKINFGTETSVNISSSSVASTPLVEKDPATYYYVTLEAISVGRKRLPYTSSSNGSKISGNMIIDSGTTLTFLDAEFYGELATALEEAIGSERVSDPRGVLSACFRVENERALPIITVHFSGKNSDMKLRPLNTFVRVEDELVCFTMIPSDSLAILGNLSQMNFLVGFDMEDKTVSFKPTDCSKQ